MLTTNHAYCRFSKGDEIEDEGFHQPARAKKQAQPQRPSALFSKKVAEQQRDQRQDGLCDHEIEGEGERIPELIGCGLVKIQDCFVIFGPARGRWR